MHGQKIPDSLNKLLIVVAIAVCAVCAVQVRKGGGAGWYVILGLAGYFVIAGVYQLLFKR